MYISVNKLTVELLAFIHYLNCALELTWSGAIIPGQFGPIKRLFDCLVNACLTRTISCCGIPSVMHTIRPISASIASKMAAAAPGGGT